MSISLADMNQLIADLRVAYDEQLQPMFLLSPEMKHQVDVIISQRPHQRLLRKCQYRRIYRRRKREKK